MGPALPFCGFVPGSPRSFGSKSSLGGGSAFAVVFRPVNSVHPWFLPRPALSRLGLACRGGWVSEFRGLGFSILPYVSVGLGSRGVGFASQGLRSKVWSTHAFKGRSCTGFIPLTGFRQGRGIQPNLASSGALRGHKVPSPAAPEGVADRTSSFGLCFSGPD